jgi:hypothetical protein
MSAADKRSSKQEGEERRQKEEGEAAANGSSKEQEIPEEVSYGSSTRGREVYSKNCLPLL